MSEHDGSRLIVAEIALSEETWEALTADYRGLYRHLSDDPFAEDMPLDERIDLFVDLKTSGWRTGVSSPWAGENSFDDVPF